MCVRLYGAKGIHSVRAKNSYLTHFKVRQLLVTGKGNGEDFSHANLRGVNLASANLADANLRGVDFSDSNLINANLSRADLTKIQLDGANLSSAILTGAYLEDWSIDSQTKLDRVQCEYFFKRLPTSDNPNPDRVPETWTETLAEGEFIRRIPVVEPILEVPTVKASKKRRFAKHFPKIVRSSLNFGKSLALLLALFLGTLAPFGNRIAAVAYMAKASGQGSSSDEAIASYRRATQLNPKVAGFYNSLGDALYEREKYDEALAAYQRAIQLDPNYAVAHSNLGNTWSSKGDLDKALASYRNATRISPQDALYLDNIGDALYKQQKWDEAIAAYRQAIHVDSSYTDAYRSLGTVLKEQGKVDEAIAAYRQAIFMNADDAVIQSELGNALNGKGKSDDAIAAFQRAIQLDFNYAEAYQGLGDALSQQKKWDEAIAAYQRAIELNPGNARTHDSLGDAWFAREKWNEARTEYQKAIEIDPNSPDTYNDLGVALLQQKRLDEALAVLQKAIQLNPRRPNSVKNLGVALYLKGQVDEGIETYRKVIALDPQYASDYHQNIGYFLQSTGKLQEAISQYEQAFVLNPNLKGNKKNLEEVQRLLAFQKNPQLSLLPERLLTPQQDALVLQKRSVVKIIVKNSLTWSDGTGWVVKREGNKAWIITNRHVAMGCGGMLQLNQTIEVEFYSEPPPGQFRKRRPARVVKMTKSDDSLDLAVLEVTDIPQDIRALPLAAAEVSPEAPIHLIGYPNTSKDWTVSEGKVLQKADLELRTSAFSTDGSSGSPVLDDRGRVVGLIWGSNTDGEKFNYSLAFPIASVRDRLQSWGIL